MSLLSFLWLVLCPSLLHIRLMHLQFCGLWREVVFRVGNFSLLFSILFLFGFNLLFFQVRFGVGLGVGFLWNALTHASQHYHWAIPLAPELMLTCLLHPFILCVWVCTYVEVRGQVWRVSLSPTMCILGSAWIIRLQRPLPTQQSHHLLELNLSYFLECPLTTVIISLSMCFTVSYDFW